MQLTGAQMALENGMVAYLHGHVLIYTNAHQGAAMHL